MVLKWLRASSSLPSAARRLKATHPPVENPYPSRFRIMYSGVTIPIAARPLSPILLPITSASATSAIASATEEMRLGQRIRRNILRQM